MNELINILEVGHISKELAGPMVSAHSLLNCITPPHPQQQHACKHTDTHTHRGISVFVKLCV